MSRMAITPGIRQDSYGQTSGQRTYHQTSGQQVTSDNRNILDSIYHQKMFRLSEKLRCMPFHSDSGKQTLPCQDIVLRCVERQMDSRER